MSQECKAFPIVPVVNDVRHEDDVDVLRVGPSKKFPLKKLTRSAPPLSLIAVSALAPEKGSSIRMPRRPGTLPVKPTNTPPVAAAQVNDQPGKG